MIQKKKIMAIFVQSKQKADGSTLTACEHKRNPQRYPQAMWITQFLQIER
ncbi:hypothetical protein XFLM_04730 [Xylella fastidiosa subsp. fastidiosa GB514]|nr:hypothetical protein XFLM_04730 [Xylella fastidiosa subsp. fastidiosa GB514]